MPHTAAHGLVLNLASIEARSIEPAETTLQRADVPPLEIAVGEFAEPEVAALYQQLHSYPVGNSGQEMKPRTHGAKYWIAPVRRELMHGLDVVLGVRGDDAVLDRVAPGLGGAFNATRYGLPFAGDNSFLIDRVDVLDRPRAARWWAPLQAGDTPRARGARLTLSIDRADASRTRTALFAPISEPAEEPPQSAWVWTPRAPVH
jgi:CRISPR-associated protein Cas5t